MSDKLGAHYHISIWTNPMLDDVKDYYGKTLQHSSDLKTDACCTLDQPADYLKTIFSKIHSEVHARYYGCGLVAPESLRGLRILDLGSGSGRDAYTLSALVGEHGSVVGVDMTDEQLAVATQHIDFHRQAFGYQKSNVEFHKGYLEKLDALGVKSSLIVVKDGKHGCWNRLPWFDEFVTAIDQWFKETL